MSSLLFRELQSMSFFNSRFFVIWSTSFVSKTVFRIFHFRFRFVFVKIYIFVQQKA